MKLFGVYNTDFGEFKLFSTVDKAAQYLGLSADWEPNFEGETCFLEDDYVLLAIDTEDIDNFETAEDC
jgi:hypothetical protein